MTVKSYNDDNQLMNAHCNRLFRLNSMKLLWNTSCKRIQDIETWYI